MEGLSRNLSVLLVSSCHLTNFLNLSTEVAQRGERLCFDFHTHIPSPLLAEAHTLSVKLIKAISEARAAHLVLHKQVASTEAFPSVPKDMNLLKHSEAMGGFLAARFDKDPDGYLRLLERYLSGVWQAFTGDI
jgi:hypothetical protein